MFEKKSMMKAGSSEHALTCRASLVIVLVLLPVAAFMYNYSFYTCGWKIGKCQVVMLNCCTLFR